MMVDNKNEINDDKWDYYKKREKFYDTMNDKKLLEYWMKNMFVGKSKTELIADLAYFDMRNKEQKFLKSMNYLNKKEKKFWKGE